MSHWKLFSAVDTQIYGFLPTPRCKASGFHSLSGHISAFKCENTLRAIILRVTEFLEKILNVRSNPIYYILCLFCLYNEKVTSHFLRSPVFKLKCASESREACLKARLRGSCPSFRFTGLGEA